MTSSAHLLKTLTPSISKQPPEIKTSIWDEIKDGNLIAADIFSRHYSKYHYRDKRVTNRFVGPGERIVLLSGCKRALLVWKKFKSLDNQEGICCSIFRNESKMLSSELLLSAEPFVLKKWGPRRLYTYVNSNKVKSNNPGFCFKSAGWNFCGVTKKRKLHILEKMLA